MSRQSNKRKRNRGTVRWWDGPFEFLWPLTFLGVVILIFGARSMFPERDIRQLMGTRNEPSKKEVVHFNDEETAPGIPKPFYVSRDCGFEN
ncbi:MAG: hypothetical protein QF830_05110, partial [Rhodospirillales bacterium]|nr:hypothetical protein [Rhodospirillales bacterium]